MNEQKFHALLALIVPAVVAEIAGEYALTETEAASRYYRSGAYAALEREDTKLWHLSPKALFEIYREEAETGVLRFPEEAC